MKRLFSILLSLGCALCATATNVVWQIGQADHSAADLALGPSGYKQFLAHDFGYEDRYFLVGTSVPARDFPYVLPGPDDTWGGTWNTSGWRTHDANILFGIDRLPQRGQWNLVVTLVDANPNRSMVKVVVNGTEKKFEIKGHSAEVLEGRTHDAKSQTLVLPLTAKDLRTGGNMATISVLEGGWIVFDQVRLEGTDGLKLKPSGGKAFLRRVQPSTYETLVDGHRVQPLLVDVEHLSGRPTLSVRLDGKEIFSSRLDSARYLYEVPMPAVTKSRKSQYQIYADGQLLEKGTVTRSARQLCRWTAAGKGHRDAIGPTTVLAGRLC